MQRIFVATDGSADADRAVDVAAELATAAGGKLSAVAGNLLGDETRQLTRAEGNIGDALEAVSNRILMQAKERARRIGAADIQVQTCWGDAAEAIIETAQRENVEAVVLGRRGGGRLRGLLRGSVSQKVVRPCPVCCDRRPMRPKPPQIHRLG